MSRSSARSPRPSLIRICYHDPDPIFAGGPPPCVRVAQYDDPEIMTALIEPDSLVIPEETITIAFDYPLGVATTRTFARAGGFTRRALFHAIFEGYRAIYAEEAADIGAAPPDPHAAHSVARAFDADTAALAGGLLNRRATAGRHQIWGHDLGDLFLEAVIRVRPGVYELAIGS